MACPYLLLLKVSSHYIEGNLRGDFKDVYYGVPYTWSEKVTCWPNYMIWAKTEGNKVFLHKSVVIIYPQIRTSYSYFVVDLMLLDALATISSNEKIAICFGYAFVLVLRINATDGQMPPMDIFYLLSSFKAPFVWFSFQTMWNANIWPYQTISVHQNAISPISYVQKLRITSFFAHKIDSL